MIRHSGNSNLTLHYEQTYQGYSVQTQRGPLVKEYLDRLLQVIHSSIAEHARVFAFRVDLRFPSDQVLHDMDSNHVLEKFINSFKAKIRHNRNLALRMNPYAHDTNVRFVWCREVGQQGIPHYHLTFFLNNNAYCTLGRFEPDRNNIFNRLHEAWGSALGIPIESTWGLVEFPENPYYLLQRSDPSILSDFIHRASYLCKAATKEYGNWVHGFGASRC